MKVVILFSTPSNAAMLLEAAVNDPDPVVFMEPKRFYRSFKETINEAADKILIGKAMILEKGQDITIISWGAMMRDTLAAVKEVKEKTGRCVIVQEAQKSFGPASEIIALINDQALMYLEAKVNRVTMYDLPVPLFGREHMYMPSQKRVAGAIVETLNE